MAIESESEIYPSGGPNSQDPKQALGPGTVLGGREWWRREEQDEGARLEVKEQEREVETTTFQYWRQPLVELSEEQLSHFMGGRSEKEELEGVGEQASGRGDLLLPHLSPFLYWQQPVAALAGEQVRDILGGQEKEQEQGVEQAKENKEQGLGVPNIGPMSEKRPP